MPNPGTGRFFRRCPFDCIFFFAINPVWSGLLLGPAPVLFIAISFIVATGTLLAILSRESHLPWFSLAVTVLILAHCAGYDSAVRYVKHDNAKQEIEARPSPEKAFVDWSDTHKPDKPKPETGAAEGAAAVQSGGTKRPVPIVFVATAGGGSRAAYWTATVLGTLEDKTRREFSDHLFAISGVSGGSLGAAIFRTLVRFPRKK